MNIIHGAMYAVVACYVLGRVVFVRRAVRTFESFVREMRWALEGSLAVRLPAATDTVLLARRSKLEPFLEDCRHNGLIELGELVEDYTSTSYACLVHYFIDSTRTILVGGVVFAVTRPDRRDAKLAALMERTFEKPSVIILISSRTALGLHLTQSSPTNSIAEPPHWHRYAVDPDAGIETTLAAHRSHTAGLGGTFAEPYNDLEDCRRERQRRHEECAAWRRDQDPRKLLESDVRGVAREQFRWLGPPLIRRLAKQPVPPAKTL